MDGSVQSQPQTPFPQETPASPSPNQEGESISPQKPPFWNLNKVIVLLTVLLLAYIAGAGFYLWTPHETTA